MAKRAFSKVFGWLAATVLCLMLFVILTFLRDAGGPVWIYLVAFPGLIVVLWFTSLTAAAYAFLLKRLGLLRFGWFCYPW